MTGSPVDDRRLISSIFTDVLIVSCNNKLTHKIHSHQQSTNQTIIVFNLYNVQQCPHSFNIYVLIYFSLPFHFANHHEVQLQQFLQRKGGQPSKNKPHNIENNNTYATLYVAWRSHLQSSTISQAKITSKMVKYKPTTVTIDMKSANKIG